MCKVLFLLWLVVCSTAVFGQQTSEGSLYATGKDGTGIGLCPLKSTAVKADISGFVTRVSVRQEFENSFAEPIEAVYVFPLGQNGAVDAMTMTVGDRVVRGKILRRETARQTYETAKSEGRTASLLDQERTNIFTQSVANIMPGEKVIVVEDVVTTGKSTKEVFEVVRAAEGRLPELRTFQERAARGAPSRLGWPAPIPVRRIVYRRDDLDREQFCFPKHYSRSR